MQWSPENGDVGCLETEKLFRDGVHVTQEESVVCAVGIGEGGGEVECCAIGVETFPPGDSVIVDQISRGSQKS